MEIFDKIITENGHHKHESITVSKKQKRVNEPYPTRTDNLLEVPENWNQMRYHCANGSN